MTAVEMEAAHRSGILTSVAQSMPIQSIRCLLSPMAKMIRIYKALLSERAARCRIGRYR